MTAHEPRHRGTSSGRRSFTAKFVVVVSPRRAAAAKPCRPPPPLSPLLRFSPSSKSKLDHSLADGLYELVAEPESEPQSEFVAGGDQDPDQSSEEPKVAEDKNQNDRDDITWLSKP